ncbi:hypothetical protein C8Q80DRAFT_889911 [Daedaleopsis nitida]|nr:hypothetical protein C8Q80DRAFT_889911 [Daedaleopsis nitida]
MLPLALLPLELILAGLVAAQSSTECTRNNLDIKLNNKLGQSPCTVQQQLGQACASNDHSPSLNCTCNNVYYNLCAACALCAGDDPPPWSAWAIRNNCGSGPMQFQPPPHDQLANTMIPGWAYQQLTSQQDFDMVGALAGSDSSKGLSGAARIAVYVLVPIGVAILAFLAAWLYFRHKWRKDRNSRPMWSSEEGSILSYPHRWMQRVRLSLKSRRLQSSRKDSGWAIDEDTYPLHARSTSYNDPNHPTEQGVSPSAGDDRGLSQPRPSPHSQETSSSSLLSRIRSPGIRVPTIMERLVGFRDSLRRSASYRFRYVSPTSADPSFRIDGSEPTPTPNKIQTHTVADFRPQPHATAPSFREEREQHAAERNAPLVVQTQGSDGKDARSSPENHTSDVIVISRDGEDFSMEDSATTVLTSPKTPFSARPPPSAYSGSRSGTDRTASHSGTSSWPPSPQRANTSSTHSGAYPHELRRNPDLVSPRKWPTQSPHPLWPSRRRRRGRSFPARRRPCRPSGWRSWSVLTRSLFMPCGHLLTVLLYVCGMHLIHGRDEQVTWGPGRAASTAMHL